MREVTSGFNEVGMCWICDLCDKIDGLMDTGGGVIIIGGQGLKFEAEDRRDLGE